MQDNVAAWLCHKVESQLSRKPTGTVKPGRKQIWTAADDKWTRQSNERQWSVNDLRSSKYGNPLVTWSLLCIMDVLAAFIDKRDSNTVTAPFVA